MRSVIALAWGVAVLAIVGYSIAAKEELLDSGKVTYLELAPVDPRSLMQGDYMALRFSIANDARPDMESDKPAEGSGSRRKRLATADGYIVAALDPDSVSHYKRLDDGSPLAPGEILLRYRVRKGQVKFATNAYFFEEGTAKRYQQARYGEFRVAPDGELLLTGLRDKALKPL
jgi:uncharacterized membrane-anchored protein